MSPTDEPIKPRLRVFFWSLAIVLGGLHVWVFRNDLNPDSVSYIEMAEAAVRTGRHALVNAYWSPLYPAFLSVAFRILHAPGTQVASIGSGLEAYWAHLAEVKIIAEIPERGESFLAVDPLRRREVLNKFLELGAKAVVTKNAAVAHSTEGWQEVGQTQCYVWRPSANSQ